MLPRGTILGYKASVTIVPSQLSCQTTYPNPIKGFIQAMQSKLLTANLLMLNYSVKKAAGPNQFYCAFTLQTMTDLFPSNQAVVNQVGALVATETNATPRVSEDPCVCWGTGLPIACCKTPSLVTSTGTGPTPAQLAAGLPGQCKCGPGGAQGAPMGGSSIAVCKNQVASGFWDQVLGNTYATGAAAACAAKKAVSWLPLAILGVVVLAFGALFVYGFAQGKGGATV